jgi:hypothetical protein
VQKVSQKLGSACLNLGVEASKSVGSAAPRVVLPAPFPLEVNARTYEMTAAVTGLFRLPGVAAGTPSKFSGRIKSLSKLLKAKFYTEGMATEYEKYCQASQVQLAQLYCFQYCYRNTIGTTYVFRIESKIQCSIVDQH